ncbi:MAG: SWIM zinc finger family protein [Vulcanimicrobiota bacterium]
MRFGSTWWSRRWLRSLEGSVWSTRLPADSGQVVAIEIHQGVVQAEVLDGEQYHVRFELEPLGQADWQEVLDVIAGRVSMAASLLNRRMPADVEEAFSVCGRSLLPTSAHDLEARCSCEDTRTPCRHAAAVAYVLAEALDHTPLLMFSLRGLEPERVIEALVRRWGGQPVSLEPPVAPAAPPLPEDPDEFWGEGRPVELEVGLKAPRLALALVRRLGVPYRRIDEQDWEALLGKIYDEVARVARKTALEP